MNLSVPISRHLLASLVLTFAMTSAVVAYGQGVQDNKASQQSPGGMDTVTHQEPPGAGGDWTPAQMREAKPLPMPSRNGPPVPQQVTPRPNAISSGNSSYGAGG